MPSSYEYVNWQPDDEVTSNKLKQMSDNAQWIHDNILTGSLIYRAGATGALAQGRTPGTQVAKDIYAIVLPFDSQVGVSFFDVTIDFPPVFTTPPAVTVTIENSTGANFCGVLLFVTSSKAVYRVFRRDGAAVQLNGNLDIIIVGT